LSLTGKIFDVTGRDAIHQFADTLKAIADYVGQQYTHGGDMRFMIENLSDYNFVRPPNPADPDDPYEMESWKKHLDIHWKQRGIYADNKMKLYSLVWGQLIKIIWEFVFKSDDRQYKYKAEDQAKRNFYNLQQTPDMSCQEYFKKVRNVVDVITSLGGFLADDMHLVDELPAREPRGGYTEQQKQEASIIIQEKTIAYGLLTRADRGRYGKLVEEVENDFLKGHDDYLKTPMEAYNLLVNYLNYVTVNKRIALQGGLDQVAFLTDGKKTKANEDGRYYPHIKCFKCNQFGHYKSDCPGKVNNQSETHEEVSTPQITLTTLHISLAVKREQINPMWILCNNDSTVYVFKNKSILVNIRKTNNPIRLKGIEGNMIEVDEEGDLRGYGWVYYHPQVTANVLSFFNMAKRFQSIVYNNQE
jgi:hypothetical protein